MTAVAKLPSLSADLLALIGSYGLARTDGVSEVERLHRWEQLIAGIKQYAADCVAALSPAELGGVERDVQRALRALTEHEWISEDGCASLAANDIANTIRKLSTPRAAEAVSEEVQDAVDSILNQLGGWAKAYPLDIFSEPTDEEREWLHATKPGLMDRIAASMGRHMAKCIADDLSALTAALTPPSAKGENK